MEMNQAGVSRYFESKFTIGKFLGRKGVKGVLQTTMVLDSRGIERTLMVFLQSLKKRRKTNHCPEE